MKRSSRLSEKTATKVLELATQLYVQQEQTVSLTDLKEAGSEVQIPSDYIEQALDQLQVQAQHRRRLTVGVCAGVSSLVITLGLGLGWSYNLLASWQQRVTSASEILAGTSERGVLGLRSSEYIEKTACYNLAVQEINQLTSTFPLSVTAALFNFEPQALQQGVSASDWGQLSTVAHHQGTAQAFDQYCR